MITGVKCFLRYKILKKLINFNPNIYSLSTKKPKKEKKIKGVKYIIYDLRNKKNLYKKINFDFRYVINLGGYVDHKKKIKTLQSHFHG